VAVARSTVQDRIYGELRRALVQGGLEAGHPLRIRDLAERFGVSTMPVREALARLVSEGALEALPNRTVRVPHLTRVRLDDLERSRRLIEGGLLGHAFGRLRAILPTLRELTERYDAICPAAPEAKAAMADLNHAFHFAVYQEARSRVLLPIVESLWMQSGPVVRRAAGAFSSSGGRHATKHHHAIIRAVEKGDGAAAERALAADIGRAFALVRATLEDE
jgi:DNA-binding GntR family transcriptional regulator